MPSINGYRREHRSACHHYPLSVTVSLSVRPTTPWFRYGIVVVFRRRVLDGNPGVCPARREPCSQSLVVLERNIAALFSISKGSTCDAFCDRGSMFRLNCFLNDGVPQTKSAGMPILFRKMTFCTLEPWHYSSGCNLSFAEVNLRVIYGAP